MLYDDEGKYRSPFFQRNYGGYTRSQIGYFLGFLGDANGKKIMDPMAGQAFMLSQLPLQGAHVWLADINPAPLILAALRNPRLLVAHKALSAWFKTAIEPLRRLKVAESGIVDDWFAPLVREHLERYSEIMKLRSQDRVYSPGVLFDELPRKKQIAIAIPILAARDITSFMRSDNTTWLIKGGLSGRHSLYDALSYAIEEWQRFAVESLTQRSSAKSMGSLHLLFQRAELGDPRLRGADLVVTSPPYANRLDYTSMWAPELQVFRVITGAQIDNIKYDQMGSNIVRGRQLIEPLRKKLPASAKTALEEIRRNTDSVASAGYYYPFFHTYATSLFSAFQVTARYVRKGGILVAFIRDTVRKDVLFPSNDVIQSVAEHLGFRLVNKTRKIIRNHVGYLRKNSSSSLYGLAQQEWWIAMRKER